MKKNIGLFGGAIAAVSLMTGVFGCGGTAVKNTAGTIPVETADKSDAVVEPDTQDTVEIVDSKEVEVTLVAQLRAHYEEMGLPTALVSLLADNRVEFVVPDKFDAVAAKENAFWDYDYGLKSKSGKVDVRFKILPGENVASEQNGGNVSTANELMNVIIRLNGANLVADIQEHPKSEASSRFNADSYTTGTFQPVPEFSNKEIASAGLIYKAGRGRIIVVTLMESMEDDEARTEWITGANAIRFAEDPADGE